MPPAAPSVPVASLLATHDWSATSLGPRESWPPELAATVRLILDAGFPMVLRHGPERTLVYNDAYTLIIGERHPHAFGRSGAEVFPEVGDRFEPEYARVFAGETLHMSDVFCPLLRDGALSDAWFEMCLSPYRDSAGVVRGVLNTAIETTGRVRAERRGDAIEATLREREARLQLALDGADMGTWAWDPREDASRIDERTRDILGLDAGPPPSLADAMSRLVHPDDRALVAQRIRAALDPQGDGHLDSEHRMRRPDGREYWVRQTGQARMEGEGDERHATLVVGTLQDITARRRVDAAIREHQLRQTFLLQLGDRVRDLFDPEAILRVTLQAVGAHFGVARVLWAEAGRDPTQMDVTGEWCDGRLGELGSHLMLERFGTQIVRRWRQGLPTRTDDARSDPRELVRDARSAYESMGVQAAMCVPLLRNDRLMALLAVQEPHPRIWNDGEAGLLQEVAERTREALDRARAEAANRDSEARYRLLFDSIDDGFCVIEMIDDDAGRPCDYRFLEGNRALKQQPGLENAIGRRMRELAPDHEQEWFDRYGRIARDGVPQRFELQAGNLNGVWYDIYAFRVGDAGSGRVGVLFSDITERRVADDALRASEQRLAAMVDQLADADRRKNEFLATLAHELRNPLAPLTTAVHVIGLDEGGGERARTMRGMIDRQLRQMVRLVDDLLDVSRISRGLVVLQRQPMDLAPALHGALETSRPLIDAQGHTLRVELPDEPVRVDGDETRLAQAISNLLNNAAKYTPRGGRVTLSVRADGDHVEIVVADDGIGIAPEALEKVFEMFAQVDGARGRSQGGLGIGLAIARRMAELHDGSLQAFSDGEGRGARFVLRLPRLAAAEPTGDGAAAAPVVHEPLRVLVVDDNRDAADSLAELLQALGQDVRVAYGGAEGFALAEDFRPQLALLDLGMPGMDGHELARAIRQRTWGRALLLCALSGWSQPEDRAKSRAAGFDEHVAKPIDAATLERLLARLQPMG